MQQQQQVLVASDDLTYAVACAQMMEGLQVICGEHTAFQSRACISNNVHRKETTYVHG